MASLLTSPPVTPSQAANELLRRRRARRGLKAFTVYTKPDYQVNWHHRLLCGALDRFVAGDITRLMVFMPPQNGKSELVSRRLPARIFGEHPDASIIACSYSADLASRMNRDVQRIIDTEPYRRLYPDTHLFGSNVRTVALESYLRNSDIFEIVGRRGVYRSAGVGGGITGMGFDFGIIDDPIKNREEAESPTYREALWEWYTSTFHTRQRSSASILLTLTRWHDDDLAGRLLRRAAEDPAADQWVVLSLPAIAEAPMAEGDPRSDGDPLWPERYPLRWLLSTKATLGSYQWSALYQQRPRPREGGMFKAAWFSIVPAAPADALRVRYWDKAGTAGAGDYSVGVLMSRDAAGRYTVEDVQRGRWSSGERNAVIKQTAQLDAQRYANTVAIWVEQEPGSGGKESAEITIQQLAGYPVWAEPVTGSKDVRAMPFAAQAEAGNVRLVAADWNAAYIDELCAFPNGANDDQVDGSSGAFNKLTLGWEVETQVTYDEPVYIGPQI